MAKSPVSHPLFARGYARLRPAMDAGGVGEHRRELLAELTGRVIEVGAGDGGNFAHYPGEVSGVLAVEPEAYLRRRAAEAAAVAPVPVTVTAGVAEHIPAATDSFDAAVAFLVLCSVADPRAALGELHRVLRPGGQLRFFEHVQADAPGLRRIQRVLDATVWPLLAGGCHTGRDTVAAIDETGFRIDRLTPLRFPDARVALPTTPHVLGLATRLPREEKR